MKYLILSFLIFTGITANQETKLKGHYYVDFGYDSSLNYNGYINFNGDTFTLKHFNSLPYTGTIKYYGNNIHLESNFNSDILFSIKIKDISKDTISFNIHNKKYASYLHIISGHGKFIKTK